MLQNTYNPIIKETTYVNSFFPKIPFVSPQRIIILCNTGTGEQLVITENSKIKTGELKKKKFNWTVEIDMQPHMVSFKDKYSSQDNISDFEIEIKAMACVTEPLQVYAQGIKDVAEAMRREMAGYLEDLASRYDLDESNQLREAIKSRLGDIYYLNCGIQINGIQVTVHMEQRYKELRSKSQYEKAKAAEAQKLKAVYMEEDTAIFAEVADGRITPEEAVKRMKKSFSDDFNENLRRIRELAALYQEMQENDLVTEGVLAKELENSLRRLVMKDAKKEKNAITERDLIKELQLKNENNPYRSFDDED